MAEREEIQKRYAYHEMSNKVEQSGARRQRGEPTGEVEALQVGRMGDRIATEAAPKAKKQRTSKGVPTEPSKAKKQLAVSGETILDLGQLTGYQPSTDQARAAYETMLTQISSKNLLGNHQTPQVLRAAAEEVIIILKDPHLRDPERREQISQLLTGKVARAKGGLPEPQFTSLVQLGKQLDDYDKDTRDDTQQEMDDEMGVAVVFDESDDDEDKNDSDVDLQVVADSSSSDEESVQEGKEQDDNVVDLGDNDDEEKLVISASSKKKGKHGVDRVLSVHEIDAHYLQRQISKHVDDADAAAKMADEILTILDIRSESDVRECENRLLVLLGFDMFDTIKLLLHNRVRVWACVSLKRSQSDEERSAIEKALSASTEGAEVWDEIHSKGQARDWTSRERMKGIVQSVKSGDVSEALDSVQARTTGVKNEDPDKMDIEVDKVPSAFELDLDALAFKDGAHTMSTKKCVLPDTSWRAMKKGYEEVHVPAVRSVLSQDEKLIHIKDLPLWAQPGFKGMEKLNRVQSKMHDVALKSSENLLLCAPTGAGKTNVACLTIMNILGQYKRDLPAGSSPDGEVDPSMFDLSAFKIVYVAPMKALVQEVVKNFGDRLKPYGISVKELSGDSSLTRQQIAETQMLVTTPEKWDIVTRQGEGRAYTQLVKLVIIDEIHLLHDDRGPVLESIVARIIRQIETTAEPIRLVGLSATLPNYADVAAFLRVKPEKGLFFFDHSYRPVPLQMQYIGITERNAFKRIKLQNDICYEKAMDQRRGGHKILIFVHSRAETGKTAKALRDIALERDETSFFAREGGATQEILREESAAAKNSDLKDVLPYGFAIHHAGMAREDRELVEDLFTDGHISVLCSTATLAWGVNLPAHAVIIRGTQIYDPSKGRWAELSPLDILQMLGRAGRPQYDREGEGIILTQHTELQYYLSLTNLQLPVESQLIKTLADHLNAEVVLGTVQSIDEAVDWLGYSFLFVRMLQNPSTYGVSEGAVRHDPDLRQRRRDLAHTAATMLERSHLVRYDHKNGFLYPTPLGRVSSQFYISHSSMSVYTRNMKPNMSDIELLRLFSMSGEFAHITVREDEKLELVKLAGRVPIPVKESPSEPLAKVNVLLQAYISRMKLEGFALSADMAFVQQSAARIMRALFEIALRRNWAGLARLCLDFSNMVSYRVWRSQSPLRQYRNVPEIVARKLERKSDIEWSRYIDLNPVDLGELVGVPKMGRLLHELIHGFPRLELSAQIQPITRSMLRVELTLVPAFRFDVEVHGFVQLFHVVVEDVNGEAILHHETFSLQSKGSETEHMLVFSVPILDPLPPAYFIRVTSDRWLHSSSVLPVSFKTMILPAKFPPATELLDLQPLLPSALLEPSLIRIFPYKEFNPIQTQTFHELFKTSKNCLVCAPSGAGKSFCAIFAILRMLTTDAEGKCAYVTPTDEIANHTLENLVNVLGSVLPDASIVRLTGETGPDLELLKIGRVVVASVRQWDTLSRRWRQRKDVQAVALYIFDDLHFLGGELGPTMEIVISRVRYASSQMHEKDVSSKTRIVGLGASMANAKDLGEWMGVPSNSLFNFSPKARPFPFEVFFQAFEQASFSGRLMAMAKPVYNAVRKHFGGRSALVYVPSKRQAQLTAIDLMTYHESQGRRDFAGEHLSDFDTQIAELQEAALRQVVKTGVAYLHNGMVEADWQAIVSMFQKNAIKVLVCSVDLCWRLRCVAQLVVIMGTEYYDGREGRHVDYPITDLLHMIGRHDNSSGGKCMILCHGPKKEYLKKLLYDPLPVESHLDSYLHDPLNSEIVTKTITSMQDAIDYLTWTFLYRRLPKNPTYYGMQGVSNVYLSEHLSEMVEAVIGDLEESKCCNVSDDGDLSALNLGMIASYYYVQYRTLELIASSVTSKTKIRGILEILSASWEFSTLPIRYGEEKTMKVLARTLTHKLPDDSSFDSNTKALILLQHHFSRKTLPADMYIDQKFVLKESVTLIPSIVDVISSSGWLKPALAAMELSQMIVQGLWNKDHVLRQIPHFSEEVVNRCVAYKGEDPIESVFDILSLDDDVRNELLQLTELQMTDVAMFCNNYPSVEVTYEVEDKDDVTAGDPVKVMVTLERELDDEEEEEDSDFGNVVAPLFPREKQEAWWVVIGDLSSNTLYSLKRVNLRRRQKLTLQFLAPDVPGDYALTLFCMSDSYLGCDQEYAVELNVAASTDSGSESEGDSD